MGRTSERAAGSRWEQTPQIHRAEPSPCMALPSATIPLGIYSCGIMPIAGVRPLDTGKYRTPRSLHILQGNVGRDENTWVNKHELNPEEADTDLRLRLCFPVNPLIPVGRSRWGEAGTWAPAGEGVRGGQQVKIVRDASPQSDPCCLLGVNLIAKVSGVSVT